jgi:hypothetical protein
MWSNETTHQHEHVTTPSSRRLKIIGKGNQKSKKVIFHQFRQVVVFGYLLID